MRPIYIQPRRSRVLDILLAVAIGAALGWLLASYL
jgi:hypothetical protein